MQQEISPINNYRFRYLKPHLEGSEG
jgi:hypothetical protein